MILTESVCAAAMFHICPMPQGRGSGCPIVCLSVRDDLEFGENPESHLIPYLTTLIEAR